MVNPIFHRHGDVQRIRIDAFQATDVVAVFVGIGTPPMVRIDAAHTAEIMRSRVRVELIQPQHVFALQHMQPIERDRGDDGAAAAAHRVIAAAWIEQAMR
ncbi:hypothetical protein XGA_3381 [Xanthomonas hortorum ATCC 19865]|nr:hypothetical protein XGA_3381 [Xanthomonas hortorum ATCC 19865]